MLLRSGLTHPLPFTIFCLEKPTEANLSTFLLLEFLGSLLRRVFCFNYAIDDVLYNLLFLIRGVWVTAPQNSENGECSAPPQLLVTIAEIQTPENPVYGSLTSLFL